MTESIQNTPVEHAFFLDESSARIQYEKALEVSYDNDCHLHQFCYYLCEGSEQVQVSTETPYLIGLSQDQIVSFFQNYLAYPLPTRIVTTNTQDESLNQALEEAKTAFLSIFSEIKVLRQPMYQDALFTQPVMAEWMAKQQIKLYIYNPREPAIQLCYVIGEPQEVREQPKNLIFLPESDMIQPLLRTSRSPKLLVISPFDNEALIEQGNAFIDYLAKTYLKKTRSLFDQYLPLMKQWIPDFSQKPWRVLIFANYFTTVMRYASEQMAKAFEKEGLEVKFVINDAYSQTVRWQVMKEFVDFQPHIRFSINHLENAFLSPSVVNVVWWQDMMPELENNAPFQYRERDLFYALSEPVMLALQQKLGETEKARAVYQNQCVSEDIFYEDATHSKREVIVFVGSSYINDKKKCQACLGEEVVEKLICLMTEALQNPKLDRTAYIYELAQQYPEGNYELFRRLWVYVCRDKIIKTLIQHSPYPIELYGPDWGEDPETARYDKGAIQHGKPLADLYRSVKYGLSIQPYLVGHQRLPEIKLCGAIPLVFWLPNALEPVDYLDEVVPFKTLDELKEILPSLPDQLPDKKIRSSFTYQVFAQKVVKRIEALVGEIHDI